MTNRIELANEYHKSGMNCSQSVACAYCDLFGVDKKTIFMLSEGFGAGMGVQSVCGALSGLIMLIGLKYSSGNIETPTKANTYKMTKEAIQKFVDKNGSMICAELKGLKTGKMIRTCSGCIEDACKLAEEFLTVELSEK